jgi:hypothetical protein
LRIGVAVALLAGSAPGDAVRAQTLNPPLAVQNLPMCVAPPPSSGSDTWPVAATDVIGTTSGPLVFSSAALLANDVGMAPLTVTTPINSVSKRGSTVTGSDPFTYTPGPLVTGTETFTYEVRDAIGRRAIGLVKVTVVSDLTAPLVSISAPAAGTVSGTVTVSANASDNIGVAGVTFMDGATLLAPEITAAPFAVSWKTTSVADGAHTLTAIARDAAGNSATSRPVAVAVSNTVVTPPPPPGGVTVDKMVFSEGAGTRTTAAFSTTSAGDVLLAFAASDGPTTVGAQTLTVSGAGLTWSRVQRAATRQGVSEIWTATAVSLLTSVTVSSTQAAAGHHQSLTVVAFSGAAGIGASSAAGSITGAPRAGLVTQSAGSVVYGVGNDWDRAVARTMPAGQTKVHEFVDAAVGDTFWVQAINGPIAAAGTAVTINDTAPIADQWNLAIVEVRAGVAPPPPTPPPPPVTVPVPALAGLTQAAAQTAITTAGLMAGTVGTANSATMLSGQVISQAPSAGTGAAPNSAVNFVVSLGPASSTGPVLALSFNEADGTVATDASGNGNNGTISGATRVSGPTGFGTALSFDGAHSIVNIPHSVSLALSTGMTLDAWVNPSANAGATPNGGWRTVIMKERSTTGLSYALYGNDGNSNASRPAAYIRNGGVDKEATAGPALPIGVWSHLAATFDGAAIRLYVNGVLRSTTPASGTIAASTAPLRIGGNNVFSTPGTEFFAGLIDDVRIYNRALSAAEIATDMNTPLR